MLPNSKTNNQYENQEWPKINSEWHVHASNASDRHEMRSWLCTIVRANSRKWVVEGVCNPWRGSASETMSIKTAEVHQWTTRGSIASPMRSLGTLGLNLCVCGYDTILETDVLRGEFKYSGSHWMQYRLQYRRPGPSKRDPWRTPIRESSPYQPTNKT